MQNETKKIRLKKAVLNSIESRALARAKMKAANQMSIVVGRQEDPLLAESLMKTVAEKPAQTLVLQPAKTAAPIAEAKQIDEAQRQGRHWKKEQARKEQAQMQNLIFEETAPNQMHYLILPVPRPLIPLFLQVPQYPTRLKCRRLQSLLVPTNLIEAIL